MSKVISTGRGVTAVDAIIAKRLRERRQDMGLSQQNLSALVGTTFQQIQKYENAINRVSASRLFVIAKALDVPFEYFFGPVKGAMAKKPRASSKANVIALRPKIAARSRARA
jgi:transcriptional regulator with XRE-family HTH domain